MPSAHNLIFKILNVTEKNRCQYIGTLLPPNVFIDPAHYFLFFKSFISCN